MRRRRLATKRFTQADLATDLGKLLEYDSLTLILIEGSRSLDCETLNMNDIQLAAFELRVDELDSLIHSGSALEGTLLAACSAHAAEPVAQTACIKRLLGGGVSVNEVDKNGVTPLHRAVRFRNLAAVDLLLKNGANVNAQDRKSQSTPLHRAVTNTGAPKTAGKGDIILQIILLLLDHGADRLLKNKSGRLAQDYVKDPQILNLLANGTRG